MSEAANEKLYTTHREPLPLDMLSEGPGGEVWYRIPSWRVEFHCEALAGLDIRIHRGLGHHAAWTLSEASTGFKMYDGWQEEEDSSTDIIEQFIAITLPKLTKEIVQKSMARAREILAQRAPCPFAIAQELSDAFYEAAERERFGDPEKKTGIYHEPNGSA